MSADTILGPCPGCQEWTCRIAAGAPPEVEDRAILAHLERCERLRRLVDGKGLTTGGRLVVAPK